MFFKRFEQLAGVFTARSAIEFIVFEMQSYEVQGVLQ